MSSDTIIQLASIILTGLATYVGIAKKLTRLEERDAAKTERLVRLEAHDGDHYKAEGDHEHRITVMESKVRARG